MGFWEGVKPPRDSPATVHKASYNPLMRQQWKAQHNQVEAITDAMQKLREEAVREITEKNRLVVKEENLTHRLQTLDELGQSTSDEALTVQRLLYETRVCRARAEYLVEAIKREVQELERS